MLPREQLLQVKRLAEREGLMIHMHVAQGDREIDQMVKRYGQRTPAYLAELGYLDRPTAGRAPDGGHGRGGGA